MGRSILGGVLILILTVSVAAVVGSTESNESPDEDLPEAAANSTVSFTAATVISTSIPAITSPSTSSSTTTSPTTTTSTTTTTTLPPLYLEPDGLGLAQLGMPYDEVITEVTEELGPPTADSGWIGSNSEFGTCPGAVLRVVRWQSLRLFFSDGPTEFGRDERHFFYFSQSTVDASEPLDLRTAAGVGLGSTVADLDAAYGSFLEIDRSTTFGTNFVINAPGPSLFSGTLTSTQDDGEVTSIGGGFGCGA